MESGRGFHLPADIPGPLWREDYSFGPFAKIRALHTSQKDFHAVLWLNNANSTFSESKCTDHPNVYVCVCVGVVPDVPYIAVRPHVALSGLYIAV